MNIRKSQHQCRNLGKLHWKTLVIAEKARYPHFPSETCNPLTKCKGSHDLFEFGQEMTVSDYIECFVECHENHLLVLFLEY